MNARNLVGKKEPLSVAQQAQKLVGTIKDWSWKADQPSPQTGKFYPASKAYHDGRTEIKVSEMLDKSGKVLPQWQDDFNKSVVQWLNDLVDTKNPNINKLKDTLNLKNDISDENKQEFKQAVAGVVGQMSSQPVTTVAQTPVAPQPMQVASIAQTPGKVGNFSDYVRQQSIQ